MSALKRSRQRHQPEAKAVSPPSPALKRLKTTSSSHVPARTGLDFLVDEEARHGKKLGARLTNGVPNASASRVDESRAVVAPDTKDAAVNGVDATGSSPDNAIGISSDEESSDDSEEEEEGNEQDAQTGNDVIEYLLQNGHESTGDNEQEGKRDHHPHHQAELVQAAAGAQIYFEPTDAETHQAEDEELEEPSFGEMLQARHPDPIDVQASFPNPMADRQALIPVTGDRSLAAPSGTSLTTVLTQALRTNDKDLLESCFQTKDLPSIRTTIQRLQSQHVATLLQRLAERIHKRPGRTGNLLVWVQWSLIAHGGYLANQPTVIKELKSLAQVVQQRASGLQSLLHLKGKLDMLSAQMDLRKSLQDASRAANAWDEADDEEGVIYVEGHDDEWSDSDDAIEAAGELEDGFTTSSKSKSQRQTATPRSENSDSGDGSDQSDDVMVNGVVQDVDDESSDENQLDGELFDVEAEETSDDEVDDDEESDEEADSEVTSEDSELSDDESDAGVKAPLPKTLNRKR